jgi:uncharacterized membrane protein
MDKFLKLLASTTFWLAIAQVVSIVILVFTGKDVSGLLIELVNGIALVVSIVFKIIKAFRDKKLTFDAVKNQSR